MDKVAFFGQSCARPTHNQKSIKIIPKNSTMSDSERELRALQDAVNRRLEGINEELDDAHGENDERLKAVYVFPSF